MARRPAAAVLLLAMAVWLAPRCWAPSGRDGQQGSAPGRRALLLSLGAAQPAMAEEAANKFNLRTTDTPTGDPYLNAVQSRQGDFSIQLPVNWQTEFNDYAGRLIVSMTPVDMEALRAGQDPDLTAVRCARLPLPALLRSAKFMPREGDDQRSDWKEVALGGVTGANIAEWMMRAGQEAQMAQAGLQMPEINISVVDYAISDGPGGSTVLSWHAVSELQFTRPEAAADPNEQVQGLGGKSLVPLSEAIGRAPGPANGQDSPPQGTTGKAILRKGTVTFALALSPADHIQASYKGPLGKQYLDYIVNSLKLTA
ncbi:unnamed protein product [Symbiodinium microadriaticum]|nr:unnamed protein product [Symbiodinium microadriaticum]